MRLTEHVHHILRSHLQPGDFVIDATAGNGHDTCFLAQSVGPAGRVLAIDLQASAIEATRQRLAEAKVEAAVELKQGDHAEALEALVEWSDSQVAAIVFNLGYLPGGDKSVQTQATQTCAALEAAARLLRPGGQLCVTAYRGHPGGEAEARVVENWMRTRETGGWPVQCHRPPSDNQPPVLWVATRP